MKNLTLSLILLTTTIATAQNVGINNTTPHSSAILDIAATNKGLLIPRLPLTSVLDVTTIPAPLTSLMVYNTATAGIAPNDVKPGYYYYNGTKWVGIGGDAWMLTGNAGTSSATDFIGTTDNQDLVFKHNNIHAGLLNADSGATSFGVNALVNKNSASANSAFGAGAMLRNTTGPANTAMGYATLQNNTIGLGNTGIGYEALYSNVSGNYNTALGYYARFGGVTGNANTAVGTYSTGGTGSNNTGVGYSSLGVNSTGSDNTAIGLTALSNNRTGNFNTALGESALGYNRTGNYNVSVGDHSGQLVTTTHNNTFVGAYADATDTLFTNATAIGYKAVVGASNTLILGGTGANAVNVGIGVQNTMNNRTALDVVSWSTVTSAAIGRFSRNGVVGDIGLYSGLTAGDYNSLALAGDKAIIFNNDGNALTDASTGLLIGPWTSALNPTGGNKGLKIMESGNVGIGTALPVHILEVQSPSINPQVLMGTTNITSNRGSVLFGRSALWEVGTDFFVNNSDNFFINQISSGLYALAIDNNRNVGINTISPTEKLEVNGSIKITDGTQGAGKVLTSDAAGKGVWGDRSAQLNQYFGYPPSISRTIPPSTEGVILTSINITIPAFYLFATNTPLNTAGTIPNSDIYVLLCASSVPAGTAYSSGLINYFLYNSETRISSNNVTEGLVYLTPGSYDVRLLNNSSNVIVTTNGCNFTLRSYIKP